MVQPWQAEIEIAPGQVKSLVEAQFPEIGVATCGQLSAGWDNAVFLVNDRWLFRFPRREIAVDLIDIEVRALPVLADQLPLPIPVPRFVGRPGDTFPWPFFGYRMISGRTASEAGLDLCQRVRAAPTIARFLRTLHAIPLETVELLELPADRWGRFDASRRSEQIEGYLCQALAHDIVEDVGPWMRIVESCVPDLVPPPSLSLVHGDLYSKQVLVDQAGMPCGVIDWGDLHRGDPAVDLAIGWSFLPREARESFLEAYGGVDEATWRRARFRALNHSATTAVYGYESGDKALLGESLVALDHVLDG